MNPVIDRDERMQQEFGQILINFEADMRRCCTSMRGNINDARDSIREKNAADALSYLEQMIDNIEGSLPGIAEFGAKQKALGKTIQEAQEKQFKRR